MWAEVHRAKTRTCFRADFSDAGELSTTVVWRIAGKGPRLPRPGRISDEFPTAAGQF